MSAFERLLDTLAHDRDRLTYDRDRREYDRDVATLVERIRGGGKHFHKAMASLTGEIETMAKAMSANVAQARTDQRQTAIDSLARINAKATEMAASGQLTGEQGAILDGLLHLAAMRLAAL